MHEQLGHQFACQKEQDGHDSAESERHIKKILQGMPVPLSIVLGSQNGTRSRGGGEKHILDKLDLSRQGYGGHLVLSDLSQHQSIAGGHRCQHQTLKRNRQGESCQIPVKFLLINQHIRFLLVHKNLTLQIANRFARF